jgi:hypothetical protein
MKTRRTIFPLPCTIQLLLTLAITAYPARQSVATGNAIKAFFWTQVSDSAQKTGCYGYTKLGDPAASPTENRFASTFWFPTYGWWHALFPQSYLPCTMTISKAQPGIITRDPEHFSDIPWFTGFSRSDTAESIRFFFPLLPQTTTYGRYDYFTVDADSATDLEFYGAGDSIMVGTFVAKEPAANGAVDILARNAFIVELTQSNPLRISSIRCNGQFRDRISAFLGYDLSRFSKTAAWYGIDLIDTTSPPMITVHSIKIKGSLPLTAQSQTEVSWTLEGDTLVDSCVIYFSADSGKTWSTTGKVTTGTSYNFTVPSKASSTAFIKITAFGTNGEKVSSLSDQFSIVVSSAFTLSLQANANGSIVASWNPSAITTPNAKAVCIAYTTENPIQAFPANGVDTLLYPLSVTSDTISGLKTDAMYYVTAFILDSSGTFILTGPEAIDSAYAEDLTPPENLFSLSASVLDTTRVYLSWEESDNSKGDIDSVAVWYNEFHFPSEANDADSKKAGTWRAGTNGDTITGLKPATTYYFALFAADTSGNWSGATPKSRVQIRTPASGPAVLEVTTVTILGSDTQSVFADSVKLWSDDLKVSYTDTIDPWTPPPSLEGLIAIGPAFSFRYGLLSGNATVSFALTPGTIPADYSINDVRLYRYNIYTGGIRLEEGAILFDDNQNAFLTSTTDLKMPFILMIDTLAPEITGSSRVDTTAYRPQQPIVDTFQIADNIENPQIQLLAGEGSLAYSDISLYVAEGKKKQQYITTIPAYVADPCSGLRGLFIVDDGRNADSINLSRKILRSNANCDDTVTKKLTWYPVAVTAQPDQSRFGELMAGAKNENNYTYNKKEERIIQWLPLQSNKKSSDKWVEYSTATDSLFALAPGKLFWIKSGSPLPLNFGSAVIPALIDTFEITLAKKEWTDFSLPYRFSIYSGDIVDATGKKAKTAPDSIELYRWKPSSNSYSTDPVYLPGIEAASNPKTVFPGGGAFTAYNASGKTVILRIPPVCTPLSPQNNAAGLKKRSGATRQWSVKISVSTGDSTELPPIYCAALPEDNIPRYFSCPPSLLPVSARITDPVSRRNYGHMAAGTLDSGGTTFKISFTNSSEAPVTVTDRIVTTVGLPQGISARLFKKADRTTSLPAQSTTVVVSPQSNTTGYLIVGTEAFLSDFVRRITSVFSFVPYTFNRSLKIAYSLPDGTRKMSLALFDLKGRNVAHLVNDVNLNPGEGSLILKSSFSPGYYIVQMRVEIDGKSKPLILNKRWMYVR